MRNTRSLQLLLRGDGLANLAFAGVLALASDVVAEGFGMAGSGPVWVMAVASVVNGVWLLRSAGDPVRRAVLLAAEVDVAFTAVMVVLALSGAVEPWAIAAAWALAAFGVVVAVGKMLLAPRRSDRVSGSSVQGDAEDFVSLQPPAHP
jgi:hypothetical protein